MSKQIASISIELKSENDKNIVELMNLVALNNDINLKMFTTNCEIPTKTPKRFSILPIYEAKYYYGSAFVWDLMTLELVVDFPNIDKIFFYQNQNLPWRTFRQNQYSFWEKFYNNDRIEIFTTEKDIYEVLGLIWKSPKLIQEISPQSIGDLINEV